jgi:hypothetical protein
MSKKLSGVADRPRSAVSKVVFKLGQFFAYFEFKKISRFFVYCRRFINNCRQPKANRQTTTLSTRDLDKALTCCVKMVQQVSYAQELEELMKH